MGVHQAMSPKDARDEPDEAEEPEEPAELGGVLPDSLLPEHHEEPPEDPADD